MFFFISESITPISKWVTCNFYSFLLVLSGEHLSTILCNYEMMYYKQRIDSRALSDDFKVNHRKAVACSSTFKVCLQMSESVCSLSEQVKTNRLLKAAACWSSFPYAQASDQFAGLPKTHYTNPKAEYKIALFFILLFFLYCILARRGDVKHQDKLSVCCKPLRRSSSVV